jgi:hypothetical protein
MIIGMSSMVMTARKIPFLLKASQIRQTMDL